MDRCHDSGARKSAQAIHSVQSPLHARNPLQISAFLTHDRKSAFTTHRDKYGDLNNSDHRKAALSSELKGTSGTVSGFWNDPHDGDPPRRRCCGYHRGCIVPASRKRGASR